MAGRARRLPSRFASYLTLPLAGAWLFCTGVAGPLQAAGPIDPETLQRGAAFVRELDQPLSVSRENVGIRELLERLSTERKVAIVLDRRIDPGHPIDARLPPSTFRAALGAVAGQVDAVVRIVGDTVMIGPEDNLGLLRTVCVLRGLEFDALGESVERRKFELARPLTIAWDDLERPADMVQRIAMDANLKVAGLELVPHDLWGRGVVMRMTATEALSWVLVQYGLTFEWTEAATGVEIVPLKGTVAVTREHSIHRLAPDEALQRAEERFPNLDIHLQESVLVATGLIEQHDVIAALARGEDPDAGPKVVNLGSLRRRRFSLRVVRKPAAAVFRSLAENGAVDLRVDKSALQAEGVDVSEKISLEVKQATITELMEAICEPLGAKFAVKGETVYVPAPE